jgi:cell fate (sporulation/competence/biofilm development) regulator YlbF (YheA/YmcA/DUF963 family)
MESNLDNAAVLDKTLELCHTIVSQPDFVALRRNVEAFMSDEEAKQLYQTASEKSEKLQHIQRNGGGVSNEDLSEFQQHREALLQNDTARRFLEAQEQMHQLHQTVTRYVMKTMELGRVPNAEDFESCGAGCSCH